jgi:hypothetical protein
MDLRAWSFNCIEREHMVQLLTFSRTAEDDEAVNVELPHGQTRADPFELIFQG